jgi:hypothetical protein
VAPPPPPDALHPPEPLGAAGIDTHSVEVVSHWLPGAQASVVAHALPHVPAVVQRKGAQGVVVLLSAEIEERPSLVQVGTGGTQAPDDVSQANPLAQSASRAQVVAQVVASAQARLRSHDFGARQLPALSQRAIAVSTQPVPHVLPAPTYAQAEMFEPSHWP